MIELPGSIGQWVFTVVGWLTLELRHYYPMFKRWITATIETRAVKAETKQAEAEAKRDAVKESNNV